MKIGTLVTLTLLLLCGFAGAQTVNTFCSSATNCVTTGNNSHNGAETFTGLTTISDVVLGTGVLSDARFYGAKGDCVTDDTAAIQAALDANALKRPVYLVPPPGGCYKTTSPLLINSGNTLAGTGVNATIGSAEIDYYGADGTNAIQQKGNASSDTSKLAILSIRVIDKRTSPTSGDGIHCDRCVNGININENLVSGFPRADIYVGGPVGTISDSVQLINNWVTNFGTYGIETDKLQNNVTISGLRCDQATGFTGTACIYVTGTGMSPASATIAIRDVKGEIRQGAHLIWLDAVGSGYGGVEIDSAIMRQGPIPAGAAGDLLHITGSEGSGIAATNLQGSAVCTNIINNVQRGKTIPCTASGPRIARWTGGLEGYRLNTGAGSFGMLFSQDPNDETIYDKGKRVLGPCDGTSAVLSTCLGGGAELFTLQARSISEIPLKIYRFSGQTSRLFQISSESNSSLFGVNSDGTVQVTNTVTPLVAGASTSVGSATLPFATYYFGSSSANRTAVSTLATTARAVSWPDKGGTVAMTSDIQAGAAIVRGMCGGTATSSTTITLYQLGQFTSTNCTAGPSNQGAFISTGTHTLKNLVMVAVTGGVNSSSGVATVYINGSASAITCTFGTGTTCRDTTNTANVVLGDIIGVRITTQATETLANIAASLEVQ